MVGLIDFVANPTDNMLAGKRMTRDDAAVSTQVRRHGLRPRKEP